MTVLPRSEKHNIVASVVLFFCLLYLLFHCGILNDKCFPLNDLCDKYTLYIVFDILDSVCFSYNILSTVAPL